jgi:hypothetical protein
MTELVNFKKTDNINVQTASILLLVKKGFATFKIASADSDEDDKGSRTA